MQIDNNDYTEVPSGQTWIHHAWSGDMATAAYYMPKGVRVDTVGYWFPADGRGPVANDTNLVLRSAAHPVLAHHFLNYFLDLPNVLDNISFNGYMQPLTGVTPQVLVKEKILPQGAAVHGGAAVLLPPRRERTAAPGGRGRAVAAGLARRQQRNLGGADDRTPRSPPRQRPPSPRERRPAQRRNCSGWRWLRRACSGWSLLFIVPFYAVLAIGMGQLERAVSRPRSRCGTRSAGAWPTSSTWARTSSAAPRSPGRSSSARSSTSPSPRCSA